MSRKTTLTSRPPAGRRRDAHGFLRDGPPHRHPWSHYGTELAVVEAYTASERKVRLAHAALNAAGRAALRPQHPPRKGSREWLQTYIKIPEDADVRDVQSHLRTASLHVKSEPVPERPPGRKGADLALRGASIGGHRFSSTILFWKTSARSALLGKAGLMLWRPTVWRRVGFWAPLPFETAPSYCRSMGRLRETRTVNSVRDCVGRGSASHISVVINRGKGHHLRQKRRRPARRRHDRPGPGRLARHSVSSIWSRPLSSPSPLVESTRRFWIPTVVFWNAAARAAARGEQRCARRPAALPLPARARFATKARFTSFRGRRLQYLHHHKGRALGLGPRRLRRARG